MSLASGIIPWGVIYLGAGSQDIHVFADLVVAIDGTWAGDCGHWYKVPLWMEDIRT